MENSFGEKNLEVWIEKYASELFQRAVYLLPNREDAEDLVQDVFIAAYKGIDRFNQNSSPLTWLKSILNNKASDFYRNRYKSGVQINFDNFFNENQFWSNPDNLDTWSGGQSLLDDEDFNLQLRKCLEELPPKWKMLVKLAYLDEKKSPEICQEAGITPTNYWKILQRSRLQLRECLESNWF